MLRTVATRVCNLMKSVIRVFSHLLYVLVSRNGKEEQNNSVDRLWQLRDIIQSTDTELRRFLLLKKYNRILHDAGAFIPIGAKFDGRPCFPHYIYGIFISNGAKIGKNCTIFHHVTIGSNTLCDSKGNGSPSIGDDVFIGCGAKIIGRVKIGNNVRIGANCIVTCDVPDNSTVVLDKPRIIEHDTARNNSFMSYSAFHK